MTGGHAFADDIDMLYNSKSETERGWTTVLEFMKASHLELNGTKTTYATNERARANNQIAELKTPNGTAIRTLGPNQPLKILGVEFTMELNWSQKANHKRQINRMSQHSHETCNHRHPNDRSDQHHVISRHIICHDRRRRIKRNSKCH